MDFDLQKIIKKSSRHLKSKSSNTTVDDLFWVVSKSDSATNSDLNLKYYWNNYLSCKWYCYKCYLKKSFRCAYWAKW